MDKPTRGYAQAPVLEMPDNTVHLRCTLDDRGAAVVLVRGWLRGVLPRGCAAGDDMDLVVSELAANAAVHGGGGEISLSVGHEEGRLLGRLVHHRPPVGDLLARWEAMRQTSRLLLGESVEVEALAEGGRGLLVVWHLAEDFVYRPEADRSVTAWTVPGCVCGGAR